MEEKTQKKGLFGKWKLIIGIVVVCGLIVLAKVFNAQQLLRDALEWIQGLGAAGAVVFILLYILACVFFVPGSILTLAAGFLFGVIRGALFVSIGSIIGATCAFLVGRFLVRKWVEKKLESYPRFRAIDEAVGREGWKIVGLTRLSPIFPFNLLNYGYGITKVSLRDYFFASWIGMFPGTVMYVYFGSLFKSLAEIGSKESSTSTGKWIIYIIGFIATVGVTVYITRIARRALKTKVQTT